MGFEQPLYYLHEAHRLSFGAVIYHTEYMKDPFGERYHRKIGFTVLSRITLFKDENESLPSSFLQRVTSTDLIEYDLLNLYTQNSRPIVKEKAKTLEEVPRYGIETLINVLDKEFSEEDMLEYEFSASDMLKGDVKEKLTILDSDSKDILNVHNGFIPL